MGELSSKDRINIVQEKGEQAVYSETQVVKAKVVLSCVGSLVEPKAFPENIKGIETFKSKIFHSARWDTTANLIDKNIVVVGSGYSSAQVVPPLPHPPYNAKSVTQIMRSLPRVITAIPPPDGDAWWSANAPWLMRTIPGLQQTLRFTFFLNISLLSLSSILDSAAGADLDILDVGSFRLITRAKLAILLDGTHSDSLSIDHGTTMRSVL